MLMFIPYGVDNTFLVEWRVSSQASRERERKGVCTFSFSMKILHVVISSLMQYYKITMADNTEELHRRIKELEKEVAYLNDQLKQDDKFGLHWIDVPEAFDKESENKIPILEEVPELAITNDDGKPTHILIEGDNYHALTCLNYTHQGKVDVIYIDPPYNTGSDGFTYKDKRFLDKYPDGQPIPKNHPLRHSVWLSFMEKRLRLAQPLLKNDGVIYISINEEEYANLKLLCDKVFDYSNYITTITIKVRHENRILKGDKPIHETTELLLMYRNSSSFTINKKTVDNSDPSEYIYEIEELIDSPEVVNMGGRDVKVFRPGEYVIHELPADFSHLKKINIRGSIKAGNSSGRFHMSYLEERNNEFNVIYKVPNIGEDGRGARYFLSRSNKDMANGFYFQGAPLTREDTKEVPYPNFLDFESEFNLVGTEGGVPFDGGKKPIEFIKFLLQLAKWGTKDLVVLDFFGGSGSTAHAYLDANLDGQVILVQMPELTYEYKNGKKIAKNNCKNIFNAGFENITQITRKRFENIINGYIADKKISKILYDEELTLSSLKNAKSFLDNIKKLKEEYACQYDKLKVQIEDNVLSLVGETTKKSKVNPLGNSLKYYRTSFVGSNTSNQATDKDKTLLAQKAGCLLALAENTLYEQKKTDNYQIFKDKDREVWTAIYFKEDYRHKFFSPFVEEVSKLNGKKNVYIFSWGDVGSFESYFDGISGIDIKGIPQPILDIYKSLNS